MPGSKSYSASHQQSSTIHNDTNHRQTRYNFGHWGNTAIRVSPCSAPQQNKGAAVKSIDQFKTSEQVVRTKIKALSQPVQSGKIASNKDQTPMMNPNDLPHTESNTQRSIVQSIQSYCSCSLTTTVRDSTPRLEEVLDQTWYEDNQISESPSTHEKSPD